jgi:glycosyltransferase involved in cell wall biosynthesis
MKVGVVAGEMELRSTGVGRYLSGLLRGLSRWDHGIEWHLFFKGEPFEDDLWNHRFFVPHFSRFAGHPVIWEQVVVSSQIRNQRLDLLFDPAYTVPFGVGVPTAVTIHDLSFEIFPEGFGWRERWRRRLLARRASRVAHRVLVVSRHIAEELHRIYGLEPARIGVVPHGIEAELLEKTDDGASTLLEASGVERPYILSAGTVLDRRKPRLLLEVFADLVTQRPDLQLVIAGDNRMRAPEKFGLWITELGLENRVRVLGWVDDRDLASLYRGAALSFYLSAYEGFGIPPLESLVFGTPTVVGPGLALDEIWPDYPLRVSQLDRSELTAVAQRYLEDPAAGLQTVETAREILSKLGWESSSRRLVDELRKALER